MLAHACRVCNNILNAYNNEQEAKQLLKSINENLQQSRKEWLLWMFKRAVTKSCNVSGSQFWKHNNKPIELWSLEVIEQKAEYLHLNPVTAGFVSEAWHWKYSSAIDYSGGMGLIKIDYL